MMSETLKRIREERLVTQAELSQLSGVAEATICRIEKGQQRARFSTVRKLAKGLNVETRELETEAQEEEKWNLMRQDLEASMVHNLPGFVGLLAKATGRAYKVPPRRTRTLSRAFSERVVHDLQEIDRVAREARGPEEVAGLILNVIVEQAREAFPEFPPDEHPLQFLVRLAHFVESLSGPLTGWVNDEPWNYEKRHCLYRAFLSDAIRKRGFDAVHGFVVEAFEDLAPQHQGIANRRDWLPMEFRREPKRPTAVTVKRELDVWQTMTSDWDKWTRIPYGILCLSRGKGKSWDKTGETKLYDRIVHLSNEPQLVDLACKGADSVTVRNALAHGDGAYDPQTRTAKFPDDKGKIVILQLPEIRIHAVDMALSNYCMFMTSHLIMDVMYEPFRGLVQKTPP